MHLRSPSPSFLHGLHQGIPICLGYFSVAFAFGITVVSTGFPPWVAVLISITNMTSAGQLAGVTVLAAHGSLLEMAMTELVINIRYALMSFSLTQKLSPDFHLPQRLAVSHLITDEIFAVAASQRGEVKCSYMLGLIITPVLGWSIGTWLGAVAGGLLPDSMVSALGIAIYGMFIAIVVPASKNSRDILMVVCVAIAVSCLFNYAPILNDLSQGFVIIISAVSASLVGAIFRPIPLYIPEQEGTQHE